MFRGEFRDGWAGNPFCNAGPIAIRCGIVDFQGNLDTWGGAEYVPEIADWQDPFNPLCVCRGYICPIPTEAEEIINYTAPAGRPAETEPSILDKQFAEIDITDQVNWILSHTGVNRGTFSGQYAIAFCTDIGAGSTGKIYLYADETGSGYLDYGSDTPWTQDGNTAHIVGYGYLQSVSVENKSTAASKDNLISPIFPNPFNPSTRIFYNLGPNRPGTLKIFDISGKMVFERAIQGSGTLVWTAEDLGSGVYVLKVLSNGKIQSRKLVLQR
jgi:hypothetical protein